MNKIIFTFVFLIISSSFGAYAASGSADKYEVTMKKVEFCISSACSSPTVIATGSQNVDIASLNAGAEAASFGTTSGLTPGTTYTNLRVTLNRAFTMSGTVTDGSNTCTTDGDAAGTATALHAGTKNDTSGKTDTTIYIADAGDYGSGGNITLSYSNPSYAFKMTIGSPTTSEMQLIYTLQDAYTVGLTTPKIKVAFNVSTALGAAVDAGGTCRMWANEPYVTITLTD